MAGDIEAAPQGAVARAAGEEARQALEKLRLDWGWAYAIGRDGEYRWWCARTWMAWKLMAADSPDGLRAVMAADYGREKRLWCSRCGKRLAVGDSGRPVHAASGHRVGHDGHPADPVDHKPEQWRAAREIAAEYGGAVTVDATFGFLRADPAVPELGAGHFEADTAKEMRRQLDIAVTGTRWERAAEEAAR